MTVSDRDMIGVLLINVGTPDSPSVADVRKYLTQFLNDPRVIDINPISRFLLVNGIIVPFRAPKSAKLYQHIWSDKGSPLLIHSTAFKNKLQTALGVEYIVEIAMRYQNPSIESAIKKLKQKNINKLIVIPMYPQYASSSTQSSIDEVNRVLKKTKITIPVTFTKKFFDNEEFIDAVSENINKHDVNSYDFIMFSYHGLPERQILKSDTELGGSGCKIGSCCDVVNEKNQFCYRAACFETTRLLVKKLNLPAGQAGIPEGKYMTSFQSRLNDGWLKPYSDKVVAEKAQQGLKKILVVSPAFVADCLETIYEIGVEYAEIFKHNGGEKLQLVESLNDSDKWVGVLKKIVLQQ